jgi:hypothetical protein
MTATKNNVPPSSTLVMTVLVPPTSPSRNLSTLRSSRSLPDHRAYTLRPAASENTYNANVGEHHLIYRFSRAPISRQQR